MNISALNLDYRALNAQIRAAQGDVTVTDCCGQRFIGCGLAHKHLTLAGTPGNALGAYLDGAAITVHGNVQDAVGDTMNDGTLVVHGDAGDALGYAMRGGSILVRGNAGYRTGIHMKQYMAKRPAIVVGGRAGSFLGEYLAGGVIVVLGLYSDSLPVADFTGTGMHGGQIFVRTDRDLPSLPAQVDVQRASAEDLQEILPLLRSFSAHFGTDADQLMRDRFYVLRPNAQNPYKQLYVMN